MTPKAWRLTRQAEASLTGIAEWTIENFGARQADAYEADLIACCNGIAAGTAAPTCRAGSRNCRSTTEENRLAHMDLLGQIPPLPHPGGNVTGP